MDTQKVKVDLLAQLADHLEKGKLGHKVFDYGRFNAVLVGGSFISPTAHKCGTHGCAAGECPIIWPHEWHFDEAGSPKLSGLPSAVPSFTNQSLSQFFGLDILMVKHLFYPNQQDPGEFGGHVLGSFATKNEVAANIRAFIQLVQDGEVE